MDWLRDVSQGTDKHLFTHSEVSQEHFLEELLQQPPLPPRNALKEKGKLNAKNYRDRKKHQNDAMKRQIELLQHENALLRNEKYCRWCRKSYLPTVCLSHTAPPKSAHIQ